MTDIRVQRLRRRVADAVDDMDTMKDQLAEIRDCCAELSASMRKIREDSIRARQAAKRRNMLKRVV
ncbi:MULTISPECIES: hypothetical protein [unclassified Oceanobacter]|jgi:septation ring formation regulator EzrA|uniref:hypothetical protein n=1 Tax=unclassified Oceanobacter TaxID=2620260 RepID=UPI0026E17E92|nr:MULTISPECIES: hypothetical protein [unclassified Oceanobacter]MDO6683010.1 hypothetical protein [Oceanobacter sp. 5_MG-2023]MDP2507022.1 hypothetical protein [Oceanobacter sp. 3_MG-2023]MDP2548134.1 hypothetical protein [Oceanobacter sp. 4_MG-2023]MDP2609543.1 hypothetical protein [Oceanobacter sp. 1_MG-2023]MDP2612996.1 hypothetical protein [Oceanobacter sp. 2_MG-2023]